MKEWVLSIIGVVILIAVAEILLPSGRLKNVSRGAMGLIMMLVILKPLPGLRHASFDWDFTIPQNETLLNEINLRKVAAMESDGKRYLKDTCGADCTIQLTGEYADGAYFIKRVTVLVYSGNVTREVVASYYHVDETRVVIANGGKV